MDGSSGIGTGPTLLCGDCLTMLAGLPEASVDVVVTSPPYNLKLRYASYEDSREEAEYLDWMVQVAAALKRVMKPDASFFLNISGSPNHPWLPFELIVRLRSLFVLQNHITWIKSITTGQASVGHFKPVRGNRFLHHAHEHIFHLTRDGRVELDRMAIGVPYADKSNIARRGHPRDLRCRGNTWFIPYETVQSRAEKFHHPGTFPVELPRWCIRLHGRAAPVVLDPFVGTGTTVVAALQEGAHGIGIDIDPAYIAIASSRLAKQGTPVSPSAGATIE
ncbi:Modification methylase MjaV [Rhodovastum atsumiense]|uniref:Methyltransferase n=1 Tax=Rhodovastum atsumiense TaxID=504468 RepID=A0A5M6INC2_9PROT|nr:site-specific DNA-methyltransferase [Rhodovastum atsumiense]KAA5609487.1 site-specific DNA-methyltransferase [Rhodovastum atsumiense]CAH2600816.1 Modification methylase MjaV [Rhodovastum atsumiense]